MFESFNNKKAESLENNTEEIHLSNLNESDLSVMAEMVELKNYISTLNYKITQRYEEKLETFIQEISQAYSDEDLENTALYHILIGTDIPDSIATLDLEGEYSIKEFLEHTAEELSK